MEESEWDPKEEEEQGPGDKTTSSEVTEKDQRCWSPQGPGNLVLSAWTGSGDLALPLGSSSWTAPHCKPGGVGGGL